MLEYTANLLQMMDYFVLALLRQQNLQQRLFHLGYHDDLTSAGNRRLFSKAMKALAEEEAVGFVYCDVTGLKAVNDTEGHLAGDELLLRAVTALGEAFHGERLFRLGGDEFLVVYRSADYDILQPKVSLLREMAKRHQVNLAIGHSWQGQPGQNLKSLLSEAEQKMYDDKAEFYRASDMNRRR